MLRLRWYSLILGGKMRFRIEPAAALFLALWMGAFGQGNPELEVRLFFSGDVQGTFEPCGCAGGPAGGLARRTGYVAEQLKQWPGPYFHVDAGNYLDLPGPQGEAINRLMLESLEKIPISVINLGVDDLYWWPRLSELEGDASRVVSTNLRPRGEGLPQPDRYAVLEVPFSGDEGARAIRIGFLGLVDPLGVKPNSGFSGEDPVEAVRSVREELLAKADLLIVLWDMVRSPSEIAEGSPLHRVIDENPEIAVIITTEKRFVLYRPQSIGNALLLSTVERGRYLGDLTMRFDEDGKLVSLEPRFVEMKEGIPEDPAWAAKGRGLANQLR